MPMRRMACGAGTCEGGENILKQRADSPGRIQPVAGDAATAGQGHAARSAGTLGGRIAGFLAALDRGSDVHRTGKHIPPDTRILIRGPHNKFLSARDGVNEPLLPRAASFRALWMSFGATRWHSAPKASTCPSFAAATKACLQMFVVFPGFTPR